MRSTSNVTKLPTNFLSKLLRNKSEISSRHTLAVSNFIYRIVTKLCRQLGLTKQSHSGVGYEDMSKPKSWWLEETLLNQRFFVLANLEDAWKRKIKPKSQLFCHNYSQPISLILSFLKNMQNGISRISKVTRLFCIC